MKLKKGQSIHYGKTVFKEEIPDEIAIKLGMMKPAKQESKK